MSQLTNHRTHNQIPVCMYHGTPEERAELRRTVMRVEESNGDDNVDDKISASPRKSATKKSPRKGTSTPQKKTTTKTRQANGRRGTRRSGKFHRQSNDTDDDDEDSDHEGDLGDDNDEGDADYKDDESPNAKAAPDQDATMNDGTPPASPADINTFPVVITTYEIIIRDRVHLAHYNWGYIVVDEGHRLKNLDCRLMKEIKKYPSAGRMILTGTPLHVSLQYSVDFKSFLYSHRTIFRSCGRCLISYCLISFTIWIPSRNGASL